MFFDRAGKDAPSFMKKRKEMLYELIEDTADGVAQLSEKWKKATESDDSYRAGYDIYYEVVPAMDRLRSFIDHYESIASRKFYTLPMYEQMLFNR